MAKKKESGVFSLRPLSNRVVIEPAEADEVTPGGIFLPDTAKEKPLWGIVLAVGPGRRLDDGTRREPEVVIGDNVLYAAYAGAEVKVQQRTVRIVAEDEVLAVLE